MWIEKKLTFITDDSGQKSLQNIQFFKYKILSFKNIWPKKNYNRYFLYSLDISKTYTRTVYVSLKLTRLFKDFIIDFYFFFKFANF